MSSYYIAEINIARMRAPIDDPLMKDFVDRLAEINALADRSPGFVWRLADASGTGATAVQAFEDPKILVNLSVWESIEALWDYTYKSGHSGPLGDRKKWFEPMEGPFLALWWVRPGEVPTVDEGKRRLLLLKTHGPTSEAFTFKERFPPE
jgi:hypothetical protein